jgi:hypothetical protein
VECGDAITALHGLDRQELEAILKAVIPLGGESHSQQSPPGISAKIIQHDTYSLTEPRISKQK